MDKENLRIKFLNKYVRKRFFKKLKKNSNSKNLQELANKLNLPFGRIKLYIAGARSIPKNLVDDWSSTFQIEIGDHNYKIFNLKELLKEEGKKGPVFAKKKYGKDWAKITGSQGNKKLRNILIKDKELYKKWRVSIEISLKSKYGDNFYKEMGKLGGRKFIQNVDKTSLNKQLEKAFRNSFRTKIVFNGLRLRSMKELEVAKFLSLKEIPFQYEKKIMNFYPDFLIGNNLIIEVFGFDWRLHKERTIEKIKRIIKNYKVIVYTYPNCVSYFDNLSVDVATNTDQLSEIINSRI